ncbi:hypothetical protein DFH06DRAFT_1433264, partial [Mycena polygramma]
GWNSNPVARRIVNLDTCYYILTKRVKCRDACGKSCNMYNHDVLKQLPPLLRNQFPAFLTHRSGIDKSVMTLVRSTIAHGLTPSGWEHVFRELHVRKRDLAERAYLYALKAIPSQRRPSPLTPFSSFSNKNGYAGFSPSRWYISKLYVEYMGVIKRHQDQAMSALTLTTGQMDQSYKAVKYVARIEGVKVFGSLWTLTNELEQIRHMVFTPTRHLIHVERPLRGVMKSLHEHGHPPISFLWTDNVRADHQFVEEIIPTLRTNVDRTTADAGRRYPVIVVPSSLKIRLASSIQLIDQTCRSILADLEQQSADSKVCVGFSVAWDWQASKAGHFPAALIGIAIADFVHLFQIYHISTPKLVPTSLKALLSSNRVVKVGSQVQGTLDILTFLWELSEASKDNTGWIDLGVLARSKGLIPHASLAFKRIVEEVIEHTFDGLEDMRCSDWCQENLSEDQKTYAIQNAWLSLHVFKAIIEKPPAGARLSQIGLPGEKITLRNGAITVAHGSFAVQMTKFPVSEKKTVNITNTRRALITISKVIAPSFICHYHEKTLAEMGNPPFDIVVDLASLVSREVERDEDTAPIHVDRSTNVPTQMSESSQYDEDDVGSGSESDSESDDSSDEETELGTTEPADSLAASQTAPVAQGDDEFEEFMDQDLDAYIATHPEGPTPTDTRHPLVQPAQSNGPRPTRVIQDIFHEMDRLTRHISKDHSLAKQFSRWMRDAILVPDKIDKAQVEAVLKKRGITWDQAVRSKSDWVWQRVRRYVPAPDTLESVLKKLFTTHADLACSKKKIKLFDGDCCKAANAILSDVQKGWVSDPPGVALYNRLRTDEAGLTIWHCIRGTSDLEGSVHGPIRKRFASLGASVEMSVALLSDFCYRKNVRSGSRHRDGIEYDGHYDPWIEDEIDIVFQTLPFDKPRETRPGYINVSLFKPTHESFIISELPQHIRDKYNIPRHDQPIRSNTEIAPLPLVNLRGARTNRYEFLAAAQDTKFALVPVHTNEEYSLFNRAARSGGESAASNGPPNFNEMAKWWSGKVNGKNIFYKLPEQLQSHYKVWTAVRDELTTTHMTAETRKGFSQLVRSDAYTSHVLDESLSPVVQTRNAAAASSLTS